MWPTDLARRRARASGRVPHHRRGAEPAVLVIERHGGREIVAHACALAAAAGVHPGMSLAHARPLLGPRAALVRPHRPDRDAAALRSLALWALRVSPEVGLDPPAGLLIDVGGTGRLYGSEARVARSVCRAVARFGIAARGAVASTVGCARALSHHGPDPLAVVPPGGERGALAGLPVASLGIDARCAERLDAVGIGRIADLMRLSRAALPARFGPDLLPRLDRALGEAWEWFDPVRPDPPVAAGIAFEGPTTDAESVSEAVRAAVGLLCARLAQRHRGAREVALTLARADAVPEGVSVRLSSPSRDPTHLWNLLRPRVEGLNLGFGVDGVMLVAVRAAALRDGQVHVAALGGDRDAPDVARAVAETLDTLVNRLGPGRVLRAEGVASHLPERSVRLRSVLEDPPRGPAAAVTTHARPSVLLSPPEPAEAVALVPEGPVLTLRWRGRAWGVLTSRGPERIAPEWWREAEARAEREYHALQLEDGSWVWACRELLRGRWFVHGIWA